MRQRRQMCSMQDLVAISISDAAEEPRVVETFRHVIAQVWRPLFHWSLTNGLKRLDMDLDDEVAPPEATATLTHAKESRQRSIYLLCDFGGYLRYPLAARLVREIAERQNCAAHTLVMIGAAIELPAELQNHVVRFRLKLPDEAAIGKLIRQALAAGDSAPRFDWATMALLFAADRLHHVQMEIEFPQCWDGKNLDSPDHKSHMSDPVRGRCPSSHPVAIPAISYNIRFLIPDTGTEGWHLSSDMYDYKSKGGGMSIHGDWFDGWDRSVLNTFVSKCVNAGMDCHAYLLGDGRGLY